MIRCVYTQSMIRRQEMVAPIHTDIYVNFNLKIHGQQAQELQKASVLLHSEDGVDILCVLLNQQRGRKRYAVVNSSINIFVAFVRRTNVYGIYTHTCRWLSRLSCFTHFVELLRVALSTCFRLSIFNRFAKLSAVFDAIKFLYTRFYMVTLVQKI